MHAPCVAQPAQYPEVRNFGNRSTDDGRKDVNREQREKNQVRIVIEDVAVSAWDDGEHVATEMSLQNLGTATARDVRVTRVEVKGGQFSGPDSLPVSLGDLPADERAVFDSIFVLPGDGRQRLLSLEGDYRLDKKRFSFSAKIPFAADRELPGPFEMTPGEWIAQDPNQVDYPPEPPPNTEAPNAESTVLIPPGQPQLLQPDTTETGRPPDSAGVAPNGPSSNNPDPAPLILRNTPIAVQADTPPDPNAAASGSADNGVALATYNTGISFSAGTPGGMSRGQSFTNVNLFNPISLSRLTFFPQSDGGLCCDQKVIYLAKQNLFVWLLQYNWTCTLNNMSANCSMPGATIASGNRLCSDVATTENIITDFFNAWTYFDLTISNFGILNNQGLPEGLDYPDLAYSDTYLYVGVDRVQNNQLLYPGRRLVARVSLADLVNRAPRGATAEFSGCNGLNKSYFTQGLTDRMVLGCLHDGSKMRVITVRDVDNNGPVAEVSLRGGIATGSAYTSTAPDGLNWIRSTDGIWKGISGAGFRRVSAGVGMGLRDEYIFAFTAGICNPCLHTPSGPFQIPTVSFGRPNVYVRLETLTPVGSGYGVVEETDIFNTKFAFGMAGLGVNTNSSDVAISIAAGGGTPNTGGVGYPQIWLGMLADLDFALVSSSNALQVETRGTRFGDYLDVRPIPGGGWVTEAYDVAINSLPSGMPAPGFANCGTPIPGTMSPIGCAVTPRYVEFAPPPIE
jgi:hypothetical protein